MASIDSVDKQKAIYAIIEKWWLKHNSFPPKLEHLPRDINDWLLVADKDYNAIAAGFMYKTESSICIFEFVVSDPDADKEERSEAIDRLIDQAIIWKEQHGYSLLYTSISIKKYIERLKSKGFIEVDSNQSHMFHGIDNE